MQKNIKNEKSRKTRVEDLIYTLRRRPDPFDFSFAASEFRLEQAFLDEHTRYDEFGGVENYRVAKLLFGVVPIIEADTGHSWRQDGATFTQVAGAWAAILEVLRGQASKSPGGAFDVGAAIAGQKKAIALMHERIEDLVRQPSWSDALVKALMRHEPPSPETGKKKRSRRRTD